MNKYFLIIVSIMSIIKSCAKVEVEDSYDSNLIEEYKQKVISSGDEYSYSRLMEYYDTKNQPDLLPYSFMMSDKFNNARSNYFIYRDIVKLNNGMPKLFNDSLFLNVQSPQQDLVLHYLNKGVNFDEISCMKALMEYYRRKNDLEKVNSLDRRLKELLPDIYEKD